MSQRKPYKYHKRGKERFIKLGWWIIDSPAWQALSAGARSLYVELKRQFNGHNNGSVFLSHRDAADRLNATRPTVAKWFKELEQWGFIRMTQKHYLGSEGYGKAAHYALTEYPDSNRPATKEFMNIRAEKIKSP